MDNITSKVLLHSIVALGTSLRRLGTELLNENILDETQDLLDMIARELDEMLLLTRHE